MQLIDKIGNYAPIMSSIRIEKYLEDVIEIYQNQNSKSIFFIYNHGNSNFEKFREKY
jgi:hypothetical protein